METGEVFFFFYFLISCKWLYERKSEINVPFTRSLQFVIAFSLTILGIRTSFSTYLKFSPRAQGEIFEEMSLAESPSGTFVAAIFEISNKALRAGLSLPLWFISGQMIFKR